MDSPVFLYNQGHSINYIIESEYNRLKSLKAIKAIDFKFTKKSVRENVYHEIYDYLIKGKTV